MSDGSSLPGDVEQLLRRKVTSLTQLEVLLLVRDEPQTPTSVARSLRISETHAQQELQALVSSRFAATDGTSYTYAVTPKMRATVDTLAGLYPAYRVPISSAIFSKEDTRMRSFSDAFRLRGDDR